MTDIEPGAVMKGKVVRIMNFGAFVELAPNKDGMVHISKLSDKRVEKVEDAVNIGDEVTVRVLEVDKMGRINLSMKPGDMDPNVDYQRLTAEEEIPTEETAEEEIPADVTAEEEILTEEIPTEGIPK